MVYSPRAGIPDSGEGLETVPLGIRAPGRAALFPVKPYRIFLLL
jgi:hypothetical protein